MNFRSILMNYFLCASASVVNEHTEPTPKDKMAILPDVLIQHMMTFLEPKDMCALAQTSKHYEVLLKRLLMLEPHLNPIKYLLLTSDLGSKKDLRITLKTHSKELIQAFGGMIQIMQIPKEEKASMKTPLVRGVDKHYRIYYEAIFLDSSDLPVSLKIIQTHFLSRQWCLLESSMGDLFNTDPKDLVLDESSVIQFAELSYKP